MWLSLVLATSAMATEQSQTLTWALKANDAPIGTHQLTVRYLPSDGGGTSRILESVTKISGLPVTRKQPYRQQLVAHIDGNKPATFSTRIEHQGSVREVQGRPASSRWYVTTAIDGQTESTTFLANEVDHSFADWLDPLSAIGLADRKQANVLSTDSGKILSGTVQSLGTQSFQLTSGTVNATGFAWTTTEGRAELYYSADGYLVKYVLPLLGTRVEGTLQSPVPTGLDEFPLTPAVGIETR